MATTENRDEQENVNANIYKTKQKQLHVGMQPADLLSVVVFRNRMWKPQFCGFIENVNNKV